MSNYLAIENARLQTELENRAITIRAQAAEIERLREYLTDITNPYVAPGENEFSRGFNQAKEGAANIARAALEDTQ